MTEPAYRDGSLWVYVPDSPADEAWLNPGVVQGPPGQQGPPGDEGPEGPPGTARITHLISAATTIQTTGMTAINGWSFPAEAGRSYHIRGLANISPQANNQCQLGIGGNAQVSLCRCTIQWHGSGQPQWNNTYYQTTFHQTLGISLGQTGGRLSCTLDGWVVVTVAGTVAVYGQSNVNAPVFVVNDGTVLEVISTSAARHFETFGETAEAHDPQWA